MQTNCLRDPKPRPADRDLDPSRPAALRPDFPIGTTAGEPPDPKDADIAPPGGPPPETPPG